jgi:hypothetical protein
VRRVAGWSALALGGLLLAGIVTTLTVDLGPSVRGLAEREGSKRLGRQISIGRLSVRLFRGEFVVQDLEIAGLNPGDRPFLKAGRIVVAMAWKTLLNREVFVESVDMTDWQMAVEVFRGGAHSFPRLMSSQPSAGPRRFVTTVQVVRAERGEFTFVDHGTPWSTIARNLRVKVVKAPDYRGEASFSGGTIQMQSYEPMWANMQASFKIDGGLVRFDRIDLQTDGAESRLTGSVDLPRWPEQTYQVQSRVHFPRMREIFFARDAFTLFGDGDFTGTFHLYKGGRELKGDFESALAGVNSYRFPNLRGSLLWLPGSFDVTEASAGFYGGDARFSYSMKPLGAPTRPRARFDATYQGVDLRRLTDEFETAGLRLEGRAAGQNLLEWPLGRFAERTAEGHVDVDSPPGAVLLGRVPPGDLAGEASRREPEIGPFATRLPLYAVPIAGHLAYTVDPEWIAIGPSWITTRSTFVGFEGRTAYGEQSRIPFQVSSADWQESDRLLAAFMTAFGAPTGAIPIGGYGEFEGVMLNAFRQPRIEGAFRGERMRAWDVEWGRARADITIENSYVDVKGGSIVAGASEIQAEGRFSLGFPRRDRGEEIDARVRISERPLVDLRHAFELDEYPVTGLMSGEFHVYGRYLAPLGFGRMTIVEGMAYGEPFSSATAGVRLEGEGARFDALEVEKGGGRLTGAAYVGFDGTYSFNTDGRRIPMESIAAAHYPNAPLSGLLNFSASGSGDFDAPRYDVKATIADLFMGEEGIGQVTGRLGVRGKLMTVELDAASPRLVVSGSGRIALTPQADAELSFRFTDTSLDPYIRTYNPRLSPFTTVLATGTLRVVGELLTPEHLLVDGNIEQLTLSLFDYPIQNDGPVRLAFEQNRVRLDRVRLTGEGTELELAGAVDLGRDRVSLTATGDANLAVLQGFFRDVRSSGSADLSAQIDGTPSAPLVSGSATIRNGRFRHFSLPHSLEAINGRFTFDANGVRLDDVAARLGGGDVRLGGRIGLQGFGLGELAVTARGDDMRLRYPEGIRSVVDADLALRGDIATPLLTGTVTVESAVWNRRFDTGGPELLELAGGRVTEAAAPAPAASEPAYPLRFDVRILAPGTFRIENNAARIVASAELTLRGSYDRPLLFGRAEIQRGEVLFEGNRYFVTRGSIDFANPTRIEPFFDIEAETRVRVPGETYRVVFHVAGTADRFVPELTSDPPLPTVDILALLFGDPRDPRNADIRALRTPDVTEQELIRSRAARLLASPISSEVGRVVEQAFGVDTVVITPSLSDPSSQQSSRLNPTARLTIGKRISDRLFLTYSRALATSTRDQIILLEYDQSDRLAWIVSQNEDRTYALDFRVRHSF